MSNRSNKYVHHFIFLIISFSCLSAMAQEKNADAVISDFLNVYNFTTGKVARLAEAIPDDKFDWRPAEGVRSVREAVLHSAAANYFFGSFLGAAPPEGIDPQSLEKSSIGKEETITAFNTSVETVQSALKKLTEQQLDEKIDFFGNKITKRQAVFGLGDHAAEHLGQLIAYARMNNVTPPWSKKTN